MVIGPPKALKTPLRIHQHRSAKTDMLHILRQHVHVVISLRLKKFWARLIALGSAKQRVEHITHGLTRNKRIYNTSMCPPTSLRADFTHITMYRYFAVLLVLSQICAL